MGLKYNMWCPYAVSKKQFDAGADSFGFGGRVMGAADPQKLGFA